MSHILIIAPSAEAESLSRFLHTEGLTVETMANGLAAGERVLSDDFDLAIIDDLPLEASEIGGIEIVRRIRQRSLLPVMLISGRQSEMERVLAFELGADDYLHKPYLPQELLARVRAILRRAGGGVSTFRHLLKVDDFELDRLKRKVRKGGEEIILTTAEFELLELLLRRIGQAVTREEIAQVVLGRPLNQNDRSIDMHVSNLRRKLGSSGNGGRFIKAIRGIGYSFTLS